MGQLIDFIVNHWFLCSLFAILLVIFLLNEFKQRAHGIKRLSPQQVIDLMNHQHAVVIDTRESELFETGHIIGALNIKVSELETKKSKLNKFKSKPLIVVCAQGVSSTQFANALQQAGFEQVFQLEGGLAAWQQEQFPLTKEVVTKI
ncbi:MAG: rhodanese-like domain-containing protein [Gammaproteobacteria bacterium]